MLKNKYQEIIVGMGLTSLIRGIISSKKKRSTLLIDDQRFSSDSYPAHFLSLLEILSLERVGKKYDIPELIQVREFLFESDVSLVTNEWRLRLGFSPLENLKEVLRKFPEFIPENELDRVYSEDEEKFNEAFVKELKRFESLCYESSEKSKLMRYDFQGSDLLKMVFERFSQIINKEYSKSHTLKHASLLHLLGIFSEEKLKSNLGPEEIPFYFFRLLGPLYRLQDLFLTTQLKRRLELLEGDYKKSNVQYWQFYEESFENLLLESFEGVISGERVLFFSHLPEDLPFKVSSPFTHFKKTELSPVKRYTSPYPPEKITLLASSDLLGSERPYRVHSEGKDFSFYHYPYPELPGSKFEFYEKELLESYNKDKSVLPFDEVNFQLKNASSTTLDLREKRRKPKQERPVLEQLPIEIQLDEHNIKGFEYWGRFRFHSMGLLSLIYGIEKN